MLRTNYFEQHFTPTGLAWVEVDISKTPFAPIAVPPRVVWQCDKYREEIARVDREQKSVDEFNRTNKNPNLVGMVTRDMIFEWVPEKGSRELGYRSDGVVVWRELPEGKEAK